jgi:hypothetical protein
MILFLPTATFEVDYQKSQALSLIPQAAITSVKVPLEPYSVQSEQFC